MKIFIEDLAARHEGKAEQELNPDTRIKYQFSQKNIVVRVSERGLELYKCSTLGSEDDAIIITAKAPNVIHIK